MKRGSTLFLRIAVILMGIPVLSLCIIGSYVLAVKPISLDYAYILYPAIIGLFISVIPFFIALYQAFKLLNYIDNNASFSERSVISLKNIKFCATTISVIYIAIMPFLALLADRDDAPGLIIFGMVLIFASFVIAVFAALLQKLLQEAILIKSENDLTV